MVSNMSACIDVMSIHKLAGKYNSEIRGPAGKQVALGECYFHPWTVMTSTATAKTNSDFILYVDNNNKKIKLQPSPNPVQEKHWTII